MRKYLLSQNGNFYKANLHCHTTISDGRKTPEEVKEIYKRHGYSVVAYTDHNVMIPHPELRDDDFLPLIGVEININSDIYPRKDGKTCHICLISLDDGNPRQVCFTQSYLKNSTLENAPRVNHDPDAPDFERVYTPECVNEAIRLGRENRFFVTYNHPSWSREDYGDYMKYHGMNAMEIVNYGCIVEGYNDYNDRVYDDMLRGGERIGCIAADDNHNKHPEGDSHFDSCGGWTMIKAEKLEYSAITSALEAGNYYASMGPEIKELWYEDGNVHVETSPAARINLLCGVRRGGHAEILGETITSADFTLKPDVDWFRIDVIDEKGYHANSIAYFVDELSK